MIKMQEENLREQCPYCGKAHTEDNFKSSFEQDIHYRILECECGKEIHWKDSRISSGF